MIITSFLIFFFLRDRILRQTKITIMLCPDCDTIDSDLVSWSVGKCNMTMRDPYGEVHSRSRNRRSLHSWSHESFYQFTITHKRSNFSRTCIHRFRKFTMAFHSHKVQENGNSLSREKRMETLDESTPLNTYNIHMFPYLLQDLGTRS